MVMNVFSALSYLWNLAEGRLRRKKQTSLPRSETLRSTAKLASHPVWPKDED